MPDHLLPDPIALGEPAAPRPARRRRWLLLGAAALLLAAGGLWLGRHRAAAPPPPAAAAEPPPALTVGLVPARRQVLRRPAIGDGSVTAWQELILGTETGGLRVVEVGFEEGDAVRQGQVLVRLDPALPTAQLAQAAAAESEAEAALRIAEADLRRSSELARTENVARQILEQRQSAARQAAARLEAARARREEAAARLAQTRILAPSDGIVSRRSVLLGAVVQPGQEMLRLIRDGRLELDARVPELDLAGIAPGQAARVFHGEREIPAQVRAVAPVVAGDTRLGIVHLMLPAGSGLRPGMFARAEIAPPETPAALTVPQEAVVFRAGAPVVFVLPAGTDHVAQRRLVTGQRGDGQVEVLDGLAEGERVVAAGAGFLTEGDRVRVAAGP
ncbi:efflux RND transporter periplasmic adaptor subunit [Roseicella frigidaeris]|uniref:Efflux transporter periplasmic adaptor subunit n=1 Tax=Roseicella frigidaeris TaxID=2230885 RepID=A0A327M6B4_9PROT|nr:efflux RND transporter periplasmic adaptor subunit [Roseicella frigidaeris]RAI57844.1 efflux transporter periplasmic adaptor subunit [Roseicella frigidaeris]